MEPKLESTAPGLEGKAGHANLVPLWSKAPTCITRPSSEIRRIAESIPSRFRRLAESLLWNSTSAQSPSQEGQEEPDSRRAGKGDCGSSHSQEERKPAMSSEKAREADDPY